MKKNVLIQYVNRICNLFDIKEEDFFSKSKKRTLVDARHLFFFLCSRRNILVVYMVEFMNENGHDVFRTSVTHGIKSVAKKIEEDKDYKTIVQEIELSVQI